VYLSGEFAGLNFREPDAVGYTVWVLLIVDVRVVDPFGDSGALESDEAVTVAESSTGGEAGRTVSTTVVGRVDVAYG